MIKAIVVDDEKPSREVLSNYINEFCNDVEIISTASSVNTAFKAIKKNSPDLVFLDIEMGDGKGFDLIEMFDAIDFKVIFVTAHSEYAIKAFRVNALDYLLKPVKINELKAAVQKIKNIDNCGKDLIHLYKNINELLRNLREENELEPVIAIQNLKGFEVLKISDIIMCKADSYCTIFYLTGERKITSSKNLKHYDQLIEYHKFIRVHNSYMVNMKYVCSYSRQGEIFLIENNLAYLGDSHRKKFLECFIKK
jgi:two-component system, LytTR family, response regulator